MFTRESPAMFSSKQNIGKPSMNPIPRNALSKCPVSCVLVRRTIPWVNRTFMSLKLAPYSVSADQLMVFLLKCIVKECLSWHACSYEVCMFRPNIAKLRLSHFHLRRRIRYTIFTSKPKVRILWKCWCPLVQVDPFLLPLSNLFWRWTPHPVSCSLVQRIPWRSR